LSFAFFIRPFFLHFWPLPYDEIVMKIFLHRLFFFWPLNRESEPKKAVAVNKKGRDTRTRIKNRNVENFISTQFACNCLETCGWLDWNPSLVSIFFHFWGLDSFPIEGRGGGCTERDA